MIEIMIKIAPVMNLGVNGKGKRERKYKHKYRIEGSYNIRFTKRNVFQTFIK